MKSLFVLCDKDGNPFFADAKGADKYQRVWAFKHEEDIEADKKSGEKIIEYRPVKGK